MGLTAFVLAVITFVAFVEAAAAALPVPPSVTVTARELTARATAGSYCIPERQRTNTRGPAVAVLCVDAVYPFRPRARLPVRPRRLVRIDVGTRARKVQARLLHVAGREYAPVGPILSAPTKPAGGRQWRVRLPEGIGAANMLAIKVFYREGYADFWVRIRDTAGCATARPT